MICRLSKLRLHLHFILILFAAATINTSLADTIHHSNWSASIVQSDSAITLDMQGYRSSTVYTGGAISYSGDLRTKGWNPKLPFWFYLPKPRPEVDLDRISVLYESDIFKMLNGSVIASHVQTDQEIPEFVVTGLNLDFKLDMDAEGHIAGIAENTSATVDVPIIQVVFAATGEDATAYVYQTLENMGFYDTHIAEFLSGNLTLSEFRATWGLRSEPPTEEDIKLALRDTKIKISIEGGVSTDALKGKVEIETNAWAIKILKDAIKHGTSEFLNKVVTFLKNNPKLRDLIFRKIFGLEDIWKFLEAIWEE